MGDEDIFVDLEKLIEKWEDAANNARDDRYQDGLFNCVNDLQDVIDKHNEMEG